MQEGCEPPGRKGCYFKEKSENLNYFNLEMPAGSIKLQQE